VLTKTLLSANRFHLVFRSDERGMSHSANHGRGHLRETGLLLSMLTTPTVPRFQATTIFLAPRRWRIADTITNERPIALTGPHQPRFNLVSPTSGSTIGSWARWATGSETTCPCSRGRRIRCCRVLPRGLDGSRCSAPAVAKADRAV